MFAASQDFLPSTLARSYSISPIGDWEPCATATVEARPEQLPMEKYVIFPYLLAP